MFNLLLQHFEASAANTQQATAAAIEQRDCIDGSYAVKIETHAATDCSDAPQGQGASIANFGSTGPCIDTLSGHNYLKAFNDGCGRSSMYVSIPDVDYGNVYG